jgi:hypothetical protein
VGGGISPSRSRRNELRARPRLEELESRRVPATFNVISLADSGAGTLRSAITAAQGTASGGFAATTDASSTITFAAALNYGTISLQSALPTLTRNLTIGGTGIIIQGGGQNNQFSDLSVFVGSTCSISGLMFTNGWADWGGGISNGGSLTLTNCQFQVDTANKGGGGLYNGGTLIVSNTGFFENTGGSWGGGGICSGQNSTIISIDGCQISMNSASGGGGIDLLLGANCMSVTNTSISYNSAGDGGGVANAGQFTMTSGSISNNTASGTGGGIWEFDQSTCNLKGVSITSNTAGSFGGGFYLFAGATLNLDNCTLSGNTATANPGSNGGLVNKLATYTPLPNCTITDVVQNLN